MSEVRNGKKETKVDKIKGFYKKHRWDFRMLSVCVTEVAVVGAVWWLGHDYATSKMQAGLTRMFDVDHEFETRFLSTIKQIKEIDEKRNANFK